jgi:hypothetical protein
VDPSAIDRGWIAEPITTDPATYISAALAAASTFDAQVSTREEWLTYLESWFTPDTRYAEEERDSVMAAVKLELAQSVVIPEQEFESLAGAQGRMAARVIGDVLTLDVPEDSSGDMTIGTADVALTFTRVDSDGESSFDDVVRVSVQVLCGPESVPTPATAQRAGDCKVVRYFTEPLEP